LGYTKTRSILAIPDLLHQFQAQGFPLYVVTAKPQVFAQKIVAHFHLAPYFQAVYGSGLDGTYAHKQDLIAHVLAGVWPCREPQR
jgi:phosphoglycolate phosphatase